ncbi:MAG: glycoside hydrolase family 88 protein [Cyclobacteriaceae bacterium]|uniref:glycoside hydrolase family 88 protein n=1 Tax=Reichenbachiella sp. TaxID=2184521 RepID=UPI00326456EE
MKRVIIIALCISLTGCSNLQKETSSEDPITENFEFASKQTTLMLEGIGDTPRNPRNTEEDGSLRLVKSRDWTSGFFPGNLWFLYEYTGDEKWKLAAEKFTINVEDQQWNGKTHDMGFKMYCSYGNGYRLTNNPEYKGILIQSAKTLITRFNPTVGALRSWDHNADKWQFPVIIDNMMNLELLFWATKTTGDSAFCDIALSHAETTLKNHFRKDNSSYHVINYDTLTGEVLDRHTHQGYAHESAWARGQAWGLYGYTMTFRETGDQRFLDQAIKIADFILSHPKLPDDLVPYWDFDAPNIPNEPRDASAAAVIASGLYELSEYASSSSSEKYLNAANSILESLSSPTYRAGLGTNNNFLLIHSTGNWPKDSEIDVPIVYADYYWLEASLRKMKYDS